jgi:hypothetical protein
VHNTALGVIGTPGRKTSLLSFGFPQRLTNFVIASSAITRATARRQKLTANK